jgi:hypothetical protein
MPVLMNHVGILGVLVLAVNLGVGRFRMRALIANGAMTGAQADRFCLRAAAILVVVGALFELVTWLSGVPTLCQLSLPLTDARLLPSHALTVLLGAALLYWVWRRGGDRTLAVVAPAFSRGGVTAKVYTPRQVRVWLTALVVVAWTGFAVMRLTTPSVPPLPGCPG